MTHRILQGYAPALLTLLPVLIQLYTSGGVRAAAITTNSISFLKQVSEGRATYYEDIRWWLRSGQRTLVLTILLVALVLLLCFTKTIGQVTDAINSV